METLIVLLVLALLFALISLAVLADKHDEQQKNLFNAEAAREMWERKLRALEASANEAELDVMEAEQAELRGRLRLARLMGRLHFVLVTLGGAGFLADDAWQQMPPEKRRYWHLRGADLMAEKADGRPYRDYVATQKPANLSQEKEKAA